MLKMSMGMEQKLQQRQTIAQSRALELQIATEVTNAALQVEATRERLQAKYG